MRVFRTQKKEVIFSGYLIKSLIMDFIEAIFKKLIYLETRVALFGLIFDLTMSWSKILQKMDQNYLFSFFTIFFQVHLTFDELSEKFDLLLRSKNFLRTFTPF